jgi:acyl carrier protein
MGNHDTARFEGLQRENRPDHPAKLRAMSGWTREALTDRVFQILCDEILTVDEGFTPQSNLIDSGLESLAVTQLMLSIEESTGVWIDESLLTPENLESAESLAALVHEQLPKP